MTTLTEEAVPELEFATGLPGFPEAHRFMLVRLGDADSPFSILRSLDHAELEFVVAPPGMFFPDYEPEIDDSVAGRLRLDSADDALLLVIITVAEQPANSTANLLGPIVVNRHTRSAAQAVLDAGRYATKEALFPS